MAGHTHGTPAAQQKQNGKLGTHTQSDNLDDLLYIVSDKVRKLAQGVDDPKITARLIEIGTDKIECYIKNGGDLQHTIVDKVTNKRFSAKELQEQLKKYQGR